MAVVRVASVSVLSLVIALVGGAPTRVDAASCATTIVQRGSALLATNTAVLARCLQGQVRSGDLSTQCPDENADARLTALGADAAAAVLDACGPSSQTAVCLDAGTGEAFTLAFAVVPLTGAPARGPRLRCVAAMSRQVQQFAERKGRLLAQCITRALAGVAGYGPVGEGCDGPGGTQLAIAETHARLVEKVGRACGGVDGAAGTADDPDPQATLGYGSFCPGAPHCTASIDTVPELVACAGCIAEEEVSQVMRGLVALPLDAATSCELGFGRAVLSLVEEDIRDLATCEDRTLDGHGTGSCPDAETLTDLGINGTRYFGRIGSACGAPIGPSPLDVETFLAYPLIGVLYPTHAEEPDIVKRRCKTEIASTAMATTGYARRQLRALRTCHTQRLCGQTSAPCPDSETAGIIAHTADTSADDIHTRCDGYTPSALGFGATCQSSDPTCAALPTTTIGELITCLQCLGDSTVAAAAALGGL